MLSVRICCALVAGALVAGEAVAAPAMRSAPSSAAKIATPRETPLPPGGAAPVRQAQGIGRPLLYWAAGGAAIIAGVILLSQDNDETSTTTTSTTGTGS